MEFLVALPILGLVLLVIGVLTTLPLYLALRIADIREGFFKALIVNFAAIVLSVVAAIPLNMMGFLLGGIPNLLSVVLPWAVWAFVIQAAYDDADWGKAIGISLVQYILSIALGVAIVFAVLIPLGISAAAFLAV